MNKQAKYRVLIADDQEADRLFLKLAIKRHAPRLEVVGEVSDGDEVIDYLSGNGSYGDREKNPLPALLIMDVRMPRMTGIQVLEWLAKQQFPQLKIAMLADSSNVEFGAKARALGVKHFYPKDINTSVLADVVKKLQSELESGQEQRFL